MKRKNLAIGCGLTGALGVLVVFVLGALLAKGCQGCVSGTGGLFAPSNLAQTVAAQDNRVSEAVGGIVAISPLPSGSINYMNGEGSADVILFLDGEARDGEYHAQCHKPRGEDDWTITHAEVILDDGNVIPLDPPIPAGLDLP